VFRAATAIVFTGLPVILHVWTRFVHALMHVIYFREDGFVTLRTKRNMNNKERCNMNGAVPFK
jgi:hypothetical protein